MIKLHGSRGASAVIGIIMLALGSSGAGAQTVPVNFDLKQVVNNAGVDASAKALGTAKVVDTAKFLGTTTAAAAMALPAVASTPAVTRIITACSLPPSATNCALRSPRC